MERENVTCAICDKNNTTLICQTKSLYSDEMFLIVKCNKCGLIYVNPRQKWSCKKLIIEYADVVKNFVKKDGDNYVVYKHILNFIESIKKKKGKFLDIGCSTGGALIEAKKRGWEVYGIELNKSCANFCINKGIEIFQGETYEANFPDNFFDAIIMVHSIEHLYNLNKDFRKIKCMLKSGGLIYIMTPNFNNYLIRILKKLHLISENFDKLDPTAHAYYFTKSSLKKLLISNGFNIKKVKAGISGDFLLKDNNTFKKALYLFIKPILILISLFDPGSTLIALAEK